MEAWHHQQVAAEGSREVAGRNLTLESDLESLSPLSGIVMANDLRPPSIQWHECALHPYQFEHSAPEGARNKIPAGRGHVEGFRNGPTT